MSFDVYSVPFSYNGPCASLSGAGAMYNAVQNRGNEGRRLLINQRFDESSREYLNRVKGFVSSSERCIVLAGNHLSCLPVHEVAREKSMLRIVLDAHRDYATLPIDDPTHANFLSIVGDMQKVAFYGYRDGPYDTSCSAGQYSCRDLDKLRSLVASLAEGTRIYVDIDLDVIDSSLFPATGCPLPDGLSIQGVLDALDAIGLSRIDIVSFEEYTPLTDPNGRCLDIAIELISYIMEGWR